MGKLKCQKHCEIQNVLGTKVKVRHTGPKDKRVKDKEENVKHILKKLSIINISQKFCFSSA